MGSYEDAVSKYRSSVLHVEQHFRDINPLNVCSGTEGRIAPSPHSITSISLTYDVLTYPRIVPQMTQNAFCPGTARGEAAKFICLAQTVIAVPMHDSILESEGYKFQECYGSNSNMPRRPTIRTINHINRQPTPPITMLLFRFYNCNRKPFG